MNKHEVHCWVCRVPDPCILADLPASGLSSDEFQRADRFRFDKDRDRFLCTRAILRRLLAHYTGLTFGELKFTIGDHGKPELDSPVNHKDIRFNISHSGQQAALAFTKGCDVGVDIEAHRDLPDRHSVARYCLSETQYDDFASLPASEQTDAFYRFWTRKEALIKAIGKGLFEPLKGFDVAFRPGEAPGLLRGSDSFGDISCWQVMEIPVQDGYHAAVAVRDLQCRLVLHYECEWSASGNAPD